MDLFKQLKKCNFSEASVFIIAAEGIFFKYAEPFYREKKQLRDLLSIKCMKYDYALYKELNNNIKL